MNEKWIAEKENLEKKILEDCLAYEEIGRQYGCSGANIKKVAIQLGIAIIPRRKINSNETFNKGEHYKNYSICINCGKEFIPNSHVSGKYCCRECQHEYKSKEIYKSILDGDSSIMRANYTPRSSKRFILEEQNNRCAICGMPQEWNNLPLVFILDHIDGHASNNQRDNLRCICPNCDSQLNTYKSKNKNGDRSYYRYHKM